jgi:hypothetical protein
MSAGIRAGVREREEASLGWCPRCVPAISGTTPPRTCAVHCTPIERKPQVEAGPLVQTSLSDIVQLYAATCVPPPVATTPLVVDHSR